MADKFVLTVNGEREEGTTGLTLAGLLMSKNISLNTGGMAVACNAKVVPRSQWGKVVLEPNDDVEIIRATVGG